MKHSTVILGLAFIFSLALTAIVAIVFGRDLSFSDGDRNLEITNPAKNEQKPVIEPVP